MLNDQRPELQERFTLRLVSAQSNDGKKESTSTSGASVNPVSSVVNITIEQNDSPYGLLQFASEAPRNGSIVSLNDEFRMQIRESIGTLKLYIERAQGTLGIVKIMSNMVYSYSIALLVSSIVSPSCVTTERDQSWKKPKLFGRVKFEAT